MNGIDPSIERLIVRQLDGEIAEEELLVLNRELLRNPDAHRLWEAYRELDTEAAKALGAAFGNDPRRIDPAALPVQFAHRRFHYIRRHWVMAVGAAAAAILALAIPKSAVTPPPENLHVASQSNRRDAAGVAEAPIRQRTGDKLMRNAGMPLIQRNTGRDVFGVMDEKGNIYWIEVDRTRTLRRPPVQDLPRDLRETL